MKKISFLIRVVGLKILCHLLLKVLYLDSYVFLVASLFIVEIAIYGVTEKVFHRPIRIKSDVKHYVYPESEELRKV
jgi:hypothetical protein